MTDSIKVLLVEDNPADARLVREWLVEANTVRFRIAHVDRIVDALEALGKEAFHVVLLDLSLPDAQGLETLKRIRSEARGLPIVVLSYRQDEDLALQAIRMGAQDYLIKAEESGGLLARSIRYAIERNRAEARLSPKEEGLGENHHLFRAVIEGTTDYIYAKDLQGRYVMANSAAARLLGKPTEEILRRTDHELFDQRGALLITEDDRRTIQTGETQTFEESVMIDERVRTFLSTKAPWRNQRGEVIGLVGISRDITERKEAEESIRAHARQQKALAELGQHALAGFDLYALLDQAAVSVARALETEYCKILELLPNGKTLLLRAGVGWKEGLIRTATFAANSESQGGYTLLEKSPVTVEDLRTDARFTSPTLLREHGAISGASVIIPGASRPFGTLSVHSTRPRRFAQEEIRFLEGVAHLLATSIERRCAQEMIRHQAYYDMLTGLPNRSLLENHLSLAIAQADRHNDLVALMFLDLDCFKEINDTLGHPTGDQLLKAVSERLAACVRDGDTFARIGGDEFTILLPEIDTIEKVTRVAERIIAAFAPPFRLDGAEHSVSASIGIALYPHAGRDTETLLRNADTALYCAKKRGRNTFCFFSENDRQEAAPPLRRG
ncbi:diguanylate cyclase domain-containing protein [Candidatus Manganitrophus noduliformans]|uniref:Diguanylate cyclase n=1 Tax=Candidatus Manganitrophus noduliformans TaxID=2606439 RepID=A0A7X6DUI2_9BACT|nr:diguanylate cyclase [Candidatus Manganitrophus noduliformans]NKE73399.1 diguanylate cyclase [Candidatus Manganitrophus noduliformans]